MSTGKCILLVTEGLGSGGAERQLVELGRLFKEAGFVPVVVTWCADRTFHAPALKENGIEWLMIRAARLRRVLDLAALYRSRRPAAVISYLPMANQTAALARLLAKVPVLIVSERSFTDRWNLRTRITFFLYRLADAVVANSNNEARNIATHCPALAKKTLAIPNMVDAARFTPGDAAHEGSAFRFVGVGRVIPTKNLVRLAMALASLRAEGLEVTVDWYGDIIDTGLADQLTRKVFPEQDLEDAFILHGECRDVAAAYRGADAFVFPSLLEGYPNVLVEAMAAGLPVAVSDVCEHPYIVENKVNGILFDPNSVAAIADAMKYIMNLSVEEKQCMGAVNRRKVLQTNAPAPFLSKYLEICRLSH